jgi:hypothetical protein
MSRYCDAEGCGKPAQWQEWCEEQRRYIHLCDDCHTAYVTPYLASPELEQVCTATPEMPDAPEKCARE